jgi:hypothetical protein
MRILFFINKKNISLRGEHVRDLQKNYQNKLNKRFFRYEKQTTLLVATKFVTTIYCSATIVTTSCTLVKM